MADNQVPKRAPKKVTIDYRNGKIYKIVNDVNDIVYIGSTTSVLSRRFSGHKSNVGRIGNQKNRFYSAVRLIGIDHFRIILIENFSSKSKSELEAREYAITNAIDRVLLYNSRFDDKPDEEVKQRMKETNHLLGKIVKENPFFHRGGIHDDPTRKQFRFQWKDNKIQKHKSFNYGFSRTREQAYMLCVGVRDEIYPLTNAEYLAELPFAE
jgi:hypothetical protein